MAETERRHAVGKPVFNVRDAVFEREMKHGDRFDARLAPISEKVGAKMLAYNLTEVAPGKRAFPLHSHHANEECFVVTEGEGTLRFGRDEYPVKPGDIVACPPGGPEVAHQLVNTGLTPLRYLALSTTIGTDVNQYPDSGKFGVVAGYEQGMRLRDAPFGGFFSEDGKIGYWEGE
jgi:uncharacterized cupin superfamily protein